MWYDFEAERKLGNSNACGYRQGAVTERPLCPFWRRSYLFAVHTTTSRSSTENTPQAVFGKASVQHSTQVRDADIFLCAARSS